ncbi:MULTISPECIES: restriction endonuclease subunit S [Staphylococcus]|uniref:restriction endonuclease subunit S n=1 Tax=Staphylococcus TaxID=1279 RepID=UPI00265BDFAC|nr:MULTISPECIES: restriction endonuclease subunit S [Staphylococcus]MDO0985677.1 restriction endonuclease subunit S [Staphylococcus hominis]WKU12550.1 restriction endonuclease subunit S [Staphylococcus devriesei]
MEFNGILEDYATYIYRGKQPKYSTNGIPVINQKAIQWSGLNKEFLKFHNNEIKVDSRHFVKKNDLLINSTGTGTVGRVYHFKFQPEKMFVDSHITIIRTDENKLRSRFLYYQMRTNKFQNMILNEFLAGSTGQVEFNKSMVKKLPISIPEVNYQDVVIKVLDELEDKIEINKKIIANLEELSQTLFKHWFVDFEFPDRDGNPYKSSGGEMVDSELGKIPGNWKIYKLKDIASHKKETFNPKKSEEVTVKHFSLPAYDNEEQAIEEEVNKIKSNKWIINNNCVLFSKMNPDTKRIWLPVIDNKKLNVASSEFVVMESPNNKINSFIYNICLNSQFIDYLKANTTGSTNSRQRVKPTIAVNYKLAIEDSIVKKYSEIITSHMEEMKILRSEIGKLTQLRDTLLPKLMSGEIEILDDIEVNSDELSI